MKKIAVITAGLLPVPAVKGGAIETLLQNVLDYNEEKNSFKFDVYSIYNDLALEKAKNYKNTNFVFVKINKILNNIIYNFLRVLRKVGYKDPNFQYLFIKKVCKLLKNNKYDLIIVESENHFVLPIAKSNEAPMLLYLHNDKLNKNTRHCNKIFDSCSQILTVSNYIKERVCTINSNTNKVSFVLNGVDIEKFNFDDYSSIRKKLRKKYNINDDTFVYLFVGRIEPNKGVLELVKAFNNLKNKSKLVIIGGSFYSNNSKTSYVKKLEKEIEKNKKNIILTGYVNYEDIPEYHCLADCMITPSQWEEPGSLVVQECLASGLPLISSESGGTPEYTKDTLAILVKKGENFVSELSEKMELVSNDNELLNNMRNSQLEKRDYFSTKRYCEDINKFLEDFFK